MMSAYHSENTPKFLYDGQISYSMTATPRNPALHYATHFCTPSIELIGDVRFPAAQPPATDYR
jgi:hypothetical protein